MLVDEASPVRDEQAANQRPVDLVKVLPGHLDIYTRENNVLAGSRVQRRNILNMHVNVREVRIAGVAAFAELLSAENVLARFYGNRVPLHVRKKYISIGSDPDDDMVPDRVALGPT